MAGLNQETWIALHDSAKRFVEKTAGDGQWRPISRDGGFDPSTWSGMAELGWFGPAVPEELGGLGETAAAPAPIAEAVGGGNLSGPA